MIIDFEHIGKYRENNRIEAKKALGGLPHSIWETYSSFANTIGGIILLGVVELTDKTFQTVDLPDPERLIMEFRKILNDREKISANILSLDDIAVHEINGNHIISITVPRADRREKPVYIGMDPYMGTYRRDGEGDYHCTRDEVQSMLKDREERTQDMRVFMSCGMEVFDPLTVKRYFTYLKDGHQGFPWEEYEDDEILIRTGACAEGADGGVHPTAAGLLMFGYEDEIVKEFPSFFLDYQERAEDGSVVERIVSNSGRFSGNLFDFYLKISGKIVKGLPADIHRPVREAVANCMINGDYSGSLGLVIVKRKEAVCITNPGSFRMDLEDAIHGGKSDPRNAVLSRLFHLVRVGTGKGKGVPDIYAVWKKKGWQAPRIQERFRPERIILYLPLREAGKQKMEEGNYVEKQENKGRLIDFVTREIYVGKKDASVLLQLPEADAERLLKEMREEGILTVSDEREGIYILKI